MKYYSQRAICIASMFAAPVTASILMRRNFINMGQQKKALWTLIIGIASTLLIFAMIFVIPTTITDRIPNLLIPAIYTVIIALIAHKMQAEAIEKHKSEGGEFYSMWRTVGLSLVCGVVIIAGIFACAMAIPDSWDTEAYQKMQDDFLAKQDEASVVFDRLEKDSPQQNISFIEQIGIPKWKECQSIARDILKQEGLPQEYVEQTKFMIKYCDVQIEHFEKISVYLNDPSDENSQQVEQIGAQVEQIIQQMNECVE